LASEVSDRKNRGGVIMAQASNENNRGITFEEYERFIYLNTHLTKDEAREYARDAWNLGLTKTEAIVAL